MPSRGGPRRHLDHCHATLLSNSPLRGKIRKIGWNGSLAVGADRLPKLAGAGQQLREGIDGTLDDPVVPHLDEGHGRLECVAGAGPSSGWRDRQFYRLAVMVD